MRGVRVDKALSSPKDRIMSRLGAFLGPRGNIHAPEFDEGLDWINAAGPVRLADLRGKVVLLDFWTYG